MEEDEDEDCFNCLLIVLQKQFAIIMTSIKCSHSQKPSQNDSQTSSIPIIDQKLLSLLISQSNLV